MRLITLLLFAMIHCANAQQPPPLASCLSYEVNRIDKEMGEFVLKNVFAPQLFKSLEDKFPEQEIDWTAWTTSVTEYKGDDGKDKTKLKGCFDVSEIHNDSELISSIMRVSVTRFQAAMKYYSTPNSDEVPQDKIDSMLDGFENLMNQPKVKKVIKDEISDAT